MMNSFLLNLATLFGIGKLSKAPGTLATLATIPIWYVLAQAGPIIYMAIVFLLFPLGVWASQVYENQSDSHDAKEIVIDEVVGFLITMTWMPFTWQSVLFGFLLFRFFDIVKPPPIRQLDKKIPGGFGVMVDDVVAGIISSILMQGLLYQTNWLGTQISTLTAN